MFCTKLESPIHSRHYGKLWSSKSAYKG